MLIPLVSYARKHRIPVTTLYTKAATGAIPTVRQQGRLLIDDSYTYDGARLKHGGDLRIQIRLPIASEVTLQDLAEAKNMSPHELARKYVLEGIANEAS